MKILTHLWILLLLWLLVMACRQKSEEEIIALLEKDCACEQIHSQEEIFGKLIELNEQALKRTISPEDGLRCSEKLIAHIQKHKLDIDWEFQTQKLKSESGKNSRSKEGMQAFSEAAIRMEEIAQDLKEPSLLATAYSRLHVFYAMTTADGEVNKEEVSYLFKARTAARESGDSLAILTNLQHAQTMAMKLMDQERLLELSKETLAFSSPTKKEHQKFRVFAHKHIGYHYYAIEDDFDLAEKHLLKGYELAKAYLAPIHVRILARDLIALYASYHMPEKMEPFRKYIPSPDRLPFTDAYVAYGKEEYKKAVDLVYPLINSRGAMGNKGLILKFHAVEMLRLAHKAKADYPEALKYAELKNHLQDSLSQISLRSKTEVLLFEEQIKAKEQSLHTKDESIKRLIGALGIIGIQLIMLIVFLIRLKKNKRRLEEQNLLIAKQNKDLLSANKNLDSFARVASHDLRSPLRNIHFYSEVLERELPQNNKKAEEYFEVIRSSSKEMDRLLDDILTYSRAAEEIKAFKQVDLKNVIKRVKENLESEIRVRKGIIEIEELPQIYAHEGRVYQVFQNLISNSLKYQSKDRSPHIEITTKENTDYWIIELKDNGKGIPENRIPEVFTEYKRIDIDPDIPGSGLGLSIVKRHMEAHGGRIEIESAENRGTSFQLFFPKTQN
ncbi:MAG: HAMP domain-containing sensor histidine kinase [Bacteroidota bacterium]